MEESKNMSSGDGLNKPNFNELLLFVWLIDWMVFYAAFNSTSVISQRELLLYWGLTLYQTAKFYTGPNSKHLQMTNLR